MYYWLPQQPFPIIQQGATTFTRSKVLRWANTYNSRVFASSGPAAVALTLWESHTWPCVQTHAQVAELWHFPIQITSTRLIITPEQSNLLQTCISFLWWGLKGMHRVQYKVKLYWHCAACCRLPLKVYKHNNAPRYKTTLTTMWQNQILTLFVLNIYMKFSMHV